MWVSSEAELNQMARQRRESLEIENSIEDLQTVVLGSEAIRGDEDWMRVQILRYLQFVPARYLHVAAHGDDAAFEELYRDPTERETPGYLVLQYRPPSTVAFTSLGTLWSHRRRRGISL